MSPETDAPNEGHDTQRPIDNEDEVLDWDEATSKFEELHHKRKIRRYELDEGILEFEIRMLTTEEHDEAESAAAQYDQRKDEVTTDTGAVKDVLLKHGITDGPEGFKNTERNRDRLPHFIRDDLADSIENFSSIPDEMAKGFTTSDGDDR